MSVYLINMYDFRVNPIVLDIWTISVSCGVQCWSGLQQGVKKVSTATYRQRLDHLRIPDVYWMPYAEHRLVQDFHPISCFSGQLCWGPVVVRYRHERVMRQSGYVECIPAHPVHSWVSYDDMDALLRPSGGSRWSVLCQVSVRLTT